jgi:hypothetical protein
MIMQRQLLTKSKQLQNPSKIQNSELSKLNSSAIPQYQYLYIFGSSTIKIHYQNTNPTEVRSSSNVCMLFLHPAIAFLVHAFLHARMFCSLPVVSFPSACFFRHDIPYFHFGLLPIVSKTPYKIGTPKLKYFHMQLEELLKKAHICPSVTLGSPNSFLEK